MRATIKIITILTTLIIAFALAGCAGSNDDTAQESSAAAEASSSAESAQEGTHPTVEEITDDGYVEIDGEQIDIYDWEQMIVSNPLAMDTYIGKEITVVSDFTSISTTELYYYTSYEQSKEAGGFLTHKSDVGTMLLSGLIYVDIPEADRALVSTLKQGDMVKVQGLVGGFFSGATYLFLSGADYAGDIAIEKM